MISYPSYNPLTGAWAQVTNQSQAISNQQNVAQLTQAIQNQQNAVSGFQLNGIGQLSPLAGSILPTVPTGSIRPGTSNSNVNVYGNQVNLPYPLPHPTGITVNLALWQNGSYISVVIDQAYVQIIQDINQLSQNLPRQFSQPVPKRPQHQFMPEGDFSLDEMSRAEEILAELN